MFAVGAKKARTLFLIAVLLQQKDCGQKFTLTALKTHACLILVDKWIFEQLNS